jgi:hypothetical protein
MRLLGLVAVLPLLLAGCGDEPPVIDEGKGQFASPSPTACPRGAGEVLLARADLDGDGRADELSYEPPSGPCPDGGLSSGVAGLRWAPRVGWDASGAARDAAVVRVPGRSGDLVLLREQHPRGGFQAHLYGYADGHLAELTVAGEPVFPFIATDVLTDPLSARCTDGGFEVLHGRRHQPVGIVAAWDVFRTTYTVDGNTVHTGPTTKVADNVLDRDFATRFPDLVRHALFENCRVAG